MDSPPRLAATAPRALVEAQRRLQHAWRAELDEGSPPPRLGDCHVAEQPAEEELLRQLRAELPRLRLRAPAGPEDGCAFFERGFAYTLGSPDRVVLEDWLTVKVLAGDLRRLDPAQMLNDVLINFLVETMKAPCFLERVARAFPGAPPPGSLHLFNSYFCSLMAGLERATPGEELRAAQLFVATKVPGLVARRRFDLTASDVLLVPFHRGLHWNLYAVCNFKTFFRQTAARLAGAEEPATPAKLYCVALDSLHAARAAHQANFDALGRALSCIVTAMARLDCGLPPGCSPGLLSPANFVCSVAAAPLQTNALDCGPAVLENMEQIVEGLLRLELPGQPAQSGQRLGAIDLLTGSVTARGGRPWYSLPALARAKRAAMARMIIRLEREPALFAQICDDYLLTRQRALQRFLR